MQRKLFLYVGAILCLLLPACSNSVTDDVADAGGSEERATKTVRLNINEEDVSMEQSPMTRAGGDDGVYYAINIYKLGASGYEKYAYGLFTSTDNMKLLLEEGQKYKWECVELKDDKDKLYHDGDKFYQPFRKGDEAGVITNEFVKSTTTNNTEMTSGNVRIGAAEDAVTRYPRLYTLYGSLEDFDPATSSSVTLSLRRAVIGLHFKVTAPKHGSVDMSYLIDKHLTIKAGDAPVDEESVYSLHAILNASQEGYTAKVPLNITWTFEDGQTKTERLEVPVSRNAITTVNISFTDLTGSSVSFNEESGDLGTGESVDWTVGQ